DNMMNLIPVLTDKNTTQSVAKGVPTRSVGTRTRGACLVAMLVALAATAAVADDAKLAEKVNFTDHVLPIFRAKCGTCHSAGQAKGGLVLESFSAAIQGGASGTVVEAGELDGGGWW